MTGLERLIVDLVQIAEAPLYSSYRWLGRQLGREMRLSEFLGIIGQAVEKDILRLWSVDPRSGDRTEYFVVPAELEARYAAELDLDGSYDPFGFSLTLGAAVDGDPNPEWEFNLDFEAKVFEVTAVPGSEVEAMEAIGRCYPDVRASETAREDTGGLRLIVGTLTDAATN